MAERPSISIIIPARNEQDYIGAALASIARQTYPPDRLECIVVDNGSSDGTAEQVRAVQEVARHELKLAYEPEPGTARAKNRGSQEATGDILLFLDADSQLGENLLSAVSRSRQQGVPASSIRIVADSHNLLERGYFALMQVGPTLFGVRGQMFCCDRELFLELGGFSERLQLGEDLDFLRRLRDVRGREAVGHIRESFILTSARRLRRLPFHLAMPGMFARWVLAFAGIWRTRPY